MESNNMHTYYCTQDQCSSVGVVTRYGIDGQGIESRLKARLSAPVQTGPGANPASGSFPGVKDREGRGGVDHTPPSSAEVRERLQLYPCSLSRSLWPDIGPTLRFIFVFIKQPQSSRVKLYIIRKKT